MIITNIFTSHEIAILGREWSLYLAITRGTRVRVFVSVWTMERRPRGKAHTFGCIHAHT